MPSRFWIRLAAIVIAAALGVALFQSWRADQRDRAQLTSELAATKQLLAAADARQHERDAQLQQTLASLAAEKRTIVTPAQIVRELPREIPLPSPLVLQNSPATSSATGPISAGQHSANGQASSASASSAQTNAVIPAEDLKPLYDFALDCKACQAKLSTTQSDLTDEKTKTAALTRERDHALQVARGGSAWRRIARAAKWFLIGAAAGAVAAKSAH